MVVMPLERAGGQAQFIVPEQPDAPDATFGPLLNWIERNLSSNLSLPALARRAAMSRRTLSRRFRAHVGMTPAAWMARARVREAQRLLETTTLSVEAVAEAVGARGLPHSSGSAHWLTAGRSRRRPVSLRLKLSHRPFLTVIEEVDGRLV
jgi:transcriptional regulator GlxA family with amidase domain